MSLFAELKRRNVFRVAVAYLLAAWVLLQAIDFTLDAISAPIWILQVFILAAVAGFLVVLVFSWVFEVTPEGIKREKEIDRSQSITSQTGRKLDRAIIIFLTLAVVLLLADRFINTDHTGALAPVVEGRSAAEMPMSATADSAAERPPTENAAEEPPISIRSIAVLPFLALSSGPDDEYFADGLTEEILNALAQLPELLVTSRTSAFHFKGQQDISIQEIAAQLGVGTVVEGSVRRSGDRLRVTAQLIRASDGFHLWSENYDSTSDDTIAVQEDIAEQIATAMDVVLDKDKREAMRRSGLRDVEAFIAMQKGQELYENAHGDADLIGKLREANAYFEKVEERVPSYPLAYQQHSDLYIHQLMDGSTGEIGGLQEAGEVAEAMAQVRADGEAVMRHARNTEERNAAEMDLAYVTSEWQGMSARIERFARERGCAESTWISNIAMPFGLASKVLPRVEELTSCNPLFSSAWRAESRAHLWAGHPETALQVARQGSERAPGEWLSLQLIYAQVALGQFDQAELEISGRLQVEEDIRSARILVAAARGDRSTVERLLEEFYQDPKAGKYWALAYSGWLGDREASNRIAASIDAHAFGSPALSTILLWCSCGAPWDLSATPNLAADLEAGGLSWPPESPIHFPLKDW